MEHIYYCPVCKNPQFREYLISKDHFLTQEEFKIDECVSCGLKFTNPRPYKADIHKYYKSQDYISHSNTSKGLVNKIYKLIRTYTITRKIQLVKKIKKEGSILDIGSGSGEFLFSVSQNNYKATGIEPDETARSFSKSKFNLNVFDESSLDSFQANSFDIISMWHVLEHVYDLNHRIKQISNLLKNDGTLIIAVPNIASYDAKRYGTYWAAYDLPRHLYHFSQKEIWDLFNIHGYQIVKKVPMRFDSFYVSLLSEKYKSGKSNFPKALITGAASNIIARFTDYNYSSLTYLLKKKNS
ncbi:MAG: class I SAM-dependent methyltransferase [Bacteroidales bacterium]|nr:class I SAM-dependent methyltransferase [Bacteroidales bacterium]